MYVTSPDNPRRGTLDGSTFLLHPAELATGPLPPWLEDQARQWIATCNAAGALTDTPGSLLLHAPWQLVLEGPGVGRHAPFLTKEEAYKAARLARDKAAKGEGISFRSQFAQNDYVSGVRSIHVQHWDSDEGLWRTDSRPWKKSPRPRMRSPRTPLTRPLTAPDFPPSSRPSDLRSARGFEGRGLSAARGLLCAAPASAVAGSGSRSCGRVNPSSAARS